MNIVKHVTRRYFRANLRECLEHLANGGHLNVSGLVIRAEIGLKREEQLLDVLNAGFVTHYIDNDGRDV